MALQFAHLTVSEAARLAVQANVQKLILTHVSRRYRDKDIEKEACSIFANTELARDFESYQIKHV